MENNAKWEREKVLISRSRELAMLRCDVPADQAPPGIGKYPPLVAYDALIRHDAMIRQNAFLRLALLDIHQREAAQDETTCWVRSQYAPIMSLTLWVEKVLDEANAMEDRT